MIRQATLAALFASLAVAAHADGAASDAAQGYTVEPIGVPSVLKVGGTGKLGVVIKPKRPVWHVHPEAPLKVHFVAPAGVRLDRPEQGRKDALEAKSDAPRFETGFVATAPGAHEVRVDVDFFICSDVACVKQVKSVAIPVDVK